MLAEKLTELGLSSDEAKIYLTLLELGGAFASTVSNKTQIPRVNVYYVLEQLKKRKLIDVSQRGAVKFFMPEPPNVLVNHLEQQFDYAKSVLPELLSITNTNAFKPTVKSYENLDGIKSIFDQTLNAKSEVLGYTNLESLGDLLSDYLPSYTKKLIAKRIKTRWLSPSTDRARQFISRFYPKEYPTELVEILFVNPKEFNFENQIAIYDNTAAIVSLNKDELVGMLIESGVYARTQRAIFNLAWLGATSFVAK